MKRISRLALPGFLLGLLLSSLLTPQAQSFRQDRFAIGYWVGPQTKENVEQRYREIADAHFNLVVGTPAISATQQLDLCNQLGLRALVESAEPTENLPDGPACWGYLLTDEPSTADFPKLGARASEIRAKRPGRFGYVNLFPNYANSTQLGAASYDDYISKFIEIVKPEVLSMDHYPAMRPDSDTRDAYCKNLETFRQHALRARIPFWNYFYSMPFANRMDPTEAQIRWQIFTSIAYGAKGILYFCYWTPGKGNGGTGEFPKGGALITAEGRRTRHYDEARRINLELQAWGPTLMKLTCLNAFRYRSDQPVSSLAQSSIKSLTRLPTDPEVEFIVGSHQHQDGRRAVVLVNHSYSHTAWPTVNFDASIQSIVEVDKSSGAESPLLDDSPELPGIQLSFGPGDARLFLLPASK